MARKSSASRPASSGWSSGWPRRYRPHLYGSADLRGPWKTRLARTEALLVLHPEEIPPDPAPAEHVTALLAEAAGRKVKVDEDRLTQALVDGMLALIREQNTTDYNAEFRRDTAPLRRVQERLRPLLVACWKLTDDPETKDLIERLVKTMRWLPPAAARRARRGNPRQRILTATRRRLAQVGIKDRDEQTAWLEAVYLIPPPAPTPLTLPAPQGFTWAPWYAAMFSPHHGRTRKARRRRP